MRVLKPAILATMLVLVLGGCSPSDEGVQAPPTEQTFGQFVSLMRQARFDYEPADTPSALAASADAVVTGTIVGVSPGQSYAPTPDSKPEIATSVIELKVERLVAGNDGVVANGAVYIEIPHPAFVGVGSEDAPEVPFDHSAFEATVPDAYGIFFLDDRTNEPYFKTILDEGAGRPAGARLTTTFPQGFLIEDANGVLVSVNESLNSMPAAWKDLSSVEEVEALLGAAGSSP